MTQLIQRSDADEDVARTLYSLMKSNGGSFKSAKQAAFILGPRGWGLRTIHYCAKCHGYNGSQQHLDECGGTPVGPSQRSTADMSESYGIPLTDDEDVIKLHGFIGRASVVRLFIVDDEGIVAEIKASTTKHGPVVVWTRVDGRLVEGRDIAPKSAGPGIGNGWDNCEICGRFIPGGREGHGYCACGYDPRPAIFTASVVTGEHASHASRNEMCAECLGIEFGVLADRIRATNKADFREETASRVVAS